MTTIVMTGGTSGFGELTARQLVATPNTRLLLGARGSAPAGAEPIPLDLTSLASVRSFADAVSGRLGSSKIDALVLNAGVNPPDGDGRTPAKKNARSPASKSTGKAAKKKAASKKPPAKKATAKKTAAKKPTAKKSAAKKSSARKSA